PSDHTIELAGAFEHLSVAQAALGETEAARVSRERACDLQERLVGEGAFMATRLFGRAGDLQTEGRCADAIPLARKGLALLTEDDSLQRIGAHLILGQSFLELGRFREAQAELDRMPKQRDFPGVTAFISEINAERGLAARLQRKYDVALREFRT